MSMKKQWMRLALSGILACSVLPAAAEDFVDLVRLGNQNPADGVTFLANMKKQDEEEKAALEKAIAEGTIVSGSGGYSASASPKTKTTKLDTMWNFTVCPGLSENLKLSDDAEFVVMRNPKSGEPLSMGQIWLSQKDVDMTAQVISFMSDAPEIEEEFAGVFASDENGNVGKECVDALKKFNMKLSTLPLSVNMGILKAVEDIRAATGKDVPYSIAYADFRAVESLHLLRAPTRIATTGVRLYLYADGWVIPMYVKAYVWQEDEGYRFLLTFSADNEKDPLIKASDALAITAAGR